MRLVLSNFLAQSGVLMYMDMAINTAAGRESSFPWMSIDDIKSELRLACIEAAAKFDPSRIGHFPYNFFLKCAKNRLYNLGRGVVFSNNPPCVRCEHWIKKEKICAIKEEGCEEIVKHRLGMKRKLNLKSPSSMENIVVEKKVKKINLYDLTSELEALYDIIPTDLEEDFKKLIKKEKVSRKSLNRLRSIIFKHLTE